MLCKKCSPTGSRPSNKIQAVTPDDLTPELVRDIRAFTAKMTQADGMSDADWPNWLVDTYGSLNSMFAERSGNPVYLDTEILFRRDRKDVLVGAERLWSLDRADPEEYGEAEDPANWRTWYRDNLMTPAGKRVRIDNPERWAVVINILRAAYPGPALMWGVRPANDN